MPLPSLHSHSAALAVALAPTLAVWAAASFGAPPPLPRPRSLPETFLASSQGQAFFEARGFGLPESLP